MTNNKMYAPLALVMGMLVFLLNYCVKIALCSLVFTLLMFTINSVAKTFGFKKALQTISVLVALNLLFLSNHKYEVGAQLFEYLIPVSLFAVFLSAVVSMKVTSFLSESLGFVRSNLAGLLAAALIDGIAMSIYFMNYFAASKITSIFVKEFAFKFTYAVTLFVVLRIGVFAYNNFFGKSQLKVIAHD
jgi:hypothetical protein